MKLHIIILVKDVTKVGINHHHHLHNRENIINMVVNNNNNKFVSIADKAVTRDESARNINNSRAGSVSTVVRQATRKRTVLNCKARAKLRAR